MRKKATSKEKKRKPAETEPLREDWPTYAPATAWSLSPLAGSSTLHKGLAALLRHGETSELSMRYWQDLVAEMDKERP